MTEFSSGGRRRRSILMREDVLPLVTSKRFRSLACIFGGSLPGVDTRNRIVPGSWTTSNRTLPNIRLHTSSTFTAPRAISSATVSNPGQAAGGRLQTCRANRGRGNLLPKRLSSFGAPQSGEQPLALADHGSSCRYFSLTTYRSMARRAALRRFDDSQKSLWAGRRPGPVRSVRFSLSNSPSRVRRFSPILRFAVRSKWSDAKMSTSSCSRTIASSSTCWILPKKT